MAIQNLNFGTAATNDGETLLTAFPKIESNTVELNTRLGVLEVDPTTAAAVAASQSAAVQRANHTGTQLASTVSDFSEAVDDRVAALLVAGTNVTLTYNDVANTLTVAASGGGGSLTDGDKGDITVTSSGAVWTIDDPVPQTKQFAPGGTGAVNRTIQSKLQDFAFAEDFGAVGNGSTDDAAAILAAITAKGCVALQSGKNYAIGSKIEFPADDCALVCLDGQATITMLTGTGKFDQSTYVGTFANCGVYATGKNRPRLENVRFVMEANAGIRTCFAASFRNSTGAVINGCEASGYKETERPIFGLDSAIDAQVTNNYIHDCTSNSNTLASLQVTAIGVDYNRIGGVNSQGVTITGNYISQITQGSTSITQYGDQTDGINIQSVDGGSGVVSGNVISGVGEGVDCFADDWVIIGNRIESCQGYGIKLIHGASYCLVANNQIESVGRNGVVIAGTNTGTKSSVGNLVRGNLIYRVGNIVKTGSNKAALSTDGTTATFKPSRNLFIDNVCFNNGDMAYVISHESGSDNRYINNTAPASTPFVTAYSRDINGTGNIIQQPSPVSTTDNTLPRFDGTFGTLQTSGVVVDDSNNISGAGNVTCAQVLGTTVFECTRPADSPAMQVYRTDAHGSNTGIGEFRFYGRNTTPAPYQFASLTCRCDDNTAASEDARFFFNTAIAGTFATRGYIGNGFVMGSPTGGDKGAGTVNAVAVYDDNVLLTCYVLELARLGSIDLAAWAERGKDGRHGPAETFAATRQDELSPAVYAAKWKATGYLPGLPPPDDFAANPLSTGDLAQRLWETVELQAVHIDNLNTRLARLEANA